MRNDALIFDFDGTLTHLFVNYDFSERKRQMEEEMAGYGVTHGMEEGIFGVFDSVMRDIGWNDDAFSSADRIITEAELEALWTCKPIEGASDFIKCAVSLGIPVAFATNNSPLVVEKWLRNNEIIIDSPIFGRVGSRPDLMKPAPWTVTEALLSSSGTGQAVMIGDNPRDRMAAERAGTRFIGLGTTERKYQRLIEKCSDCQIYRTYSELCFLLKNGE